MRISPLPDGKAQQVQHATPDATPAKLSLDVVGPRWLVSDEDGPLRRFRTRRAAQAFAKLGAELTITSLPRLDPLADAEPALF